MTFEETVEYLYSYLPMFQRQGNAAIRRYDLTGILELCRHFGNPHERLTAIHVAGTNGKGSTCSMIASILMESGITKVGLYTSPHLKSFTERIRVNGKPIPECEVVRFVAEHKELIETLKPSFFEFTTAMAFHYFAQETDVCIIEVGMGGRLDSTNIIQPILSVITHISYDHTEFLGETLEEIAFEKAGIIKNAPIVISVTQSETEPVFRNIAKDNKQSIFFADQEIDIKLLSHNDDGNIFEINSKTKMFQNFDLTCGLTGHYQIRNIPGVLKAIEIWNDQINKKELNFPQVDQTAILNGLLRVVENSGLRGRMEVINRQPFTIADIAHNTDAIALLLKQTENIPPQNLHFVIGFVREKDLKGILKLFPKQSKYYFVCPSVPRGLPANETRQHAKNFGLIGNAYESVSEGLMVAQKNALSTDTIVVTGSAFVVAEILPPFALKA